MIGESKLKKLTELGLSHARKLGADEVEILISAGEEELTRFANNTIHQNVSREDAGITVRFIKDKKIGVATGNGIDEKIMERVAAMACKLCGLQRKDPSFVSLPAEAKYEPVADFYDGVKHLGSSLRAQAVVQIITKARSGYLSASGAFCESTGEFAVGNSHGIWGYQRNKSASLSTIFKGEKGTGFANQCTKGGSEIDVEKVAKTAFEKATTGDVVDVPAGEYEVILEPPAVAELLDFFAMYGPNARIYHEDVSFYQGSLGKKVFDAKLTVFDDPTNKLGYPMAFDYEGAAKHRLTLVDKGVLTAVAYDSYLAHKYGKENTGNALPAPNVWGPIPLHLSIAPGEVSLPAMIKGVKRGLLVTRFWYTRIIAHKQLLLTGMTRDGTFLIEDGKIVGRARNLRYTESVIEAFSKIIAIGNKLSLEGSEGSPSLVPALHLAKFRFTGVTEHG